MNTLLSMTGISKAFTGLRVLDHVDFELKRGEVHVLAGENGAGKSTLMKILSGVHRDYSGTIALQGNAVRFSSPHDAFRQGIAIIHQELSLINSMSVADNMYLGREPACGGIWRNQRRQIEQTGSVLRRLGLDIDVNRPVGEFPVSIRQMIEIARALTFDLRILIMDEPTSSLNDAEVKRLFGLIGDLKRDCGIVYITHKMDEIYQVADRITVLRDGRHVITAPAERLAKEALVSKLVGRELSEQFPPRHAHHGRAVMEVSGFSVNCGTGNSGNPVKDVSFSLHAGEIVGFAGLQGSGNSELFRGLFGAYGRQDEGQVTVAGRKYVPRSPRSALRARMALLTNDRKGDGLVSGMSTARNITLASMQKVSPGGWVREDRELQVSGKYRDQLNIRAASVGEEVSRLSGGNQQKVVLAKWLETNPRIFLLDEPTRGVDVGAKHEIYAWMNRWSAEGVAMLLITSELPELLALSDRIMVMHRGRIRAEFTRAEANQEKIMHAAM